MSEVEVVVGTEVFTVEPDVPVTIGRSMGCDIQLVDPRVSRAARQAEVRRWTLVPVRHVQRGNLAGRCARRTDRDHPRGICATGNRRCTHDHDQAQSTAN